MHDAPDQMLGSGAGRPSEQPADPAAWETSGWHRGHGTSPLYRPSERRSRDGRRRDPAWDRPVSRRRRLLALGRRTPPPPRARRRLAVASAPTVPRRRRPGAELRRLRRLIALGLVLIVSAVTLGSTLETGGGGTPATETRGPRPATTLLPSGPPRPQILASRESVQLNVPIAQSRITAIAYHRVAGAETLDLRPHGRLLNAGLFRDLERRMLGTSDPGGPDYFIADGSTASVDVGAPAGTQVYAPVDGHVIGILPNMVNGEARGSFIQIQPNDNPAEIVQLSHIVERPGNEVYVGKSVTASRTLIGTVEDLSGVLELTLARYTRDAGNHVHIEVQPSTNIPIP